MDRRRCNGIVDAERADDRPGSPNGVDLPEASRMVFMATLIVSSAATVGDPPSALSVMVSVSFAKAPADQMAPTMAPLPLSQVWLALTISVVSMLVAVIPKPLVAALKIKITWSPVWTSAPPLEASTEIATMIVGSSPTSVT